jgi:pimeloyl-ACP methyl ester carboxylesterase
VADAVLAADVRATFLNALTRATVTSSVWGAKDERRLPSWLSEEELAVYVEAFQRTGFTGPLNWYRNMDRNWELTERVAGRRVEQPAMFLTGERDPVRKFSPGETMAGWLTDMRANIVVPGAGHWVQQQAPQAVNEALLDFLAGL